LEYEPVISIPETALLSEQALAEDWNRPEEDAAWSHLQQVPLRGGWIPGRWAGKRGL
jgi:hypothetical protein